jgi:predicted ATPase
MLLKSISVNHHKIIGTKKIDFFGQSTQLKTNLTEEHHTDIILEIDNEKEENFFTFIIGKNGVGKTILFRTIVNFINANGPFEDPKLNDLINLYSKSIKYIKYNTDYSGTYELQNLDIYNSFSNTKDLIIKNFLEHYNSHLIFISSSFERSIVHRNPRYRNFNYLSDINATQTLFLKALIRFKNQKKLDILSELLERESINWKLRGYLSVHGIGGIEDDDIYLLKNENNVNIISFLRTIKKIEISKEGKLNEKNLDDTELNVFEAIYNSSIFFKFYFDSNLSFKELFNEIKNSNVLKKIELFLNKKTDDPDIEKHLNIRTPKKERDVWEILFSDIDELSEFDLNTLLLLENLELISLNVYCNDVQVNHMSSGEQSIIRLFSFFSDIPDITKNENLLVFFDEPENTLHPKWQQNFPIYFKRIVEDIYEIKSSHFFFSTHSPLVIMKSKALINSNVIKFYKDDKGQFQSHQVDNINSFSIEEVLLDEFKISYRDRELELNVNKIINEKAEQSSDPIYSIEKSFELKKKIDDLYNSLDSKL